VFKKVLIANRGEIACRIIQTLNRMGIGSVVVYSSADEDSLAVRMAEEAYLIGNAPAIESYLNSPAILKAAKQSGAEAIHPGYGFLSENAGFAEAVKKEGLVFIGPPAKAIALMGDKLEAKRLARDAGVPCIPGTDEPLGDINEAQKVAHSIGFPLMVKAAAGGGGKGMRIIREKIHLEEGLKGAIHEAEASFGDGRVFLEKYIESARHIEIQILADTHGNCIHLGERECSLQRRHQKVIEESPSPFVTEGLRESMTSAAIRLAKAVEYSSAGTVEFVVDQTRNFYFLEMNTRLQVEHPTTEMVTKLDLVEEMVRISAGEPLRMKQSDVQFSGHAIEARIYAEDSSRGFLPSIGRLSTYLPPLETEGKLRVDSGVEEGDTITPYYDPMISKLIVHETDRKVAVESLLAGLDHYYIRGIETNINFLAALVNSPHFRKSTFDTATLDLEFPIGFSPSVPENPIIAVGAAAVMHVIQKGLSQAEVTVLIDRKSYPMTVRGEGERYEVLAAESLVIETSWLSGEALFEGVFNGHSVTIQLDPHGVLNKLSWNGYAALTQVLEAHVADLYLHMPLKQKADMSRIVQSPMTGLVVEVFVKEGDPIKAGQPVATIEAMKMENIIRAEVDGVIEKIYVKQGDGVNLDQHMAKIG